MDTKIQRTPRPAGTTYLAVQYKQNATTEDKERLLNHIIYAYTTSGFRWNRRPLSLSEFSNVIGIPTTRIMEAISQSGQNMGSLISAENIKSTVESIITLSATWAIQDRGQIQKQVEDLLTSQGNQYRPFITAEVNKALKLSLDSNKNLIETFKSLLTNNQTNILNIFNQQDTQANQSLLTPEQAITMISKSHKSDTKALSSPKINNIAGLPENDLQELYQEWGIGDSDQVREMGSERKAIRPESSQGQEALELRESPHDDVSSRRGELYEDIDELPNRE
jgi:hypothetical protein